MSQFTDPATASGINWSDLNGHLLMIEVLDVKRDIVTSYGPSDAVQANVTVLDGPLTGTLYTNTLIFPKVLQSQLSPLVGKTVLGRLTQGEAKAGQSPPWKLEAATQADQHIATQHIANRQVQAHAGVTPDDLLGDGTEPF